MSSRVHPDARDAAAALRACVHCGFCLATCPTYALLGDELDSPRGRIVLVEHLLAEEARGGNEGFALVAHHLDRCLSCLSCQTTCPSGVGYGHLVDHARARLEARPLRTESERWVRRLLGWLLPRPTAFRLALAAAPLARPLARWLPEPLARAIDLARTARARTRRWIAPPPPAPDDRPTVALLVGCVQSVLDAAVHDATVRLLERLGARVIVIDGLGCCGAVNHHLGQQVPALDRVRANVRALTPHLPTLRAVASTVAGCGAMLEDYGHLLRNEPLAERAAAVSAAAADVLEVASALGLPPTTAPRPLRVAYHGACGLQHGQRVHELPVRLLRSAGFEVVEPAEAHACCGSAGTYSLLQPELSSALGDRKAHHLTATAPDVIAAGNVGCALQLADRTEIPVVHPVQLLDWATGGPSPLRASAAG